MRISDKGLGSGLGRYPMLAALLEGYSRLLGDNQSLWKCCLNPHRFWVIYTSKHRTEIWDYKEFSAEQEKLILAFFPPMTPSCSSALFLFYMGKKLAVDLLLLLIWKLIALFVFFFSLQVGTLNLLAVGEIYGPWSQLESCYLCYRRA